MTVVRSPGGKEKALAKCDLSHEFLDIKLRILIRGYLFLSSDYWGVKEHLDKPDLYEWDRPAHREEGLQGVLEGIIIQLIAEILASGSLTAAFSLAEWKDFDDFVFRIDFSSGIMLF